MHSTCTPQWDVIMELSSLFSPIRALLDKMAALDLPAQLDLEASPETLDSPDPRDLL